MITLGVDAHKEVHVAVAVDEQGRPLDSWQGANSEQAWQELQAWACQWESRQWGIEGTGNYGQGLAQHLVAAGEMVYEVNPRLTAQGRRRARKQDKNDRLDAQAVARVVLRDATQLPRVVAEDEAAVLDVMTRERDRLKSQVDRLRNQLHNCLFKVDPQYKKTHPSLSKLEAVQRLEHYSPVEDTPVAAARGACVRRVAALLALVLEQHQQITREFESLSGARYGALTEIPGVARLTAGILAGILGTRQFAAEDQFATYAGASPLETSSAGRVRHRLNRGGNRRLNRVLYLIALTQWNREGPGRSYIKRRMEQGKSWLEAVRALKRFIARAIWGVWRRHYAQKTTPALATAAPCQTRGIKPLNQPEMGLMLT
ncbi:MAG: IS110 family transposase [Pseudomonadota bacterium]|nr:IS110 family transposase [Pseudomonadota bacterium]